MGVYDTSHQYCTLKVKIKSIVKLKQFYSTHPQVWSFPIVQNCDFKLRHSSYIKTNPKYINTCIVDGNITIKYRDAVFDGCDKIFPFCASYASFVLTWGKYLFVAAILKTMRIKSN